MCQPDQLDRRIIGPRRVQNQRADAIGPLDRTLVYVDMLDAPERHGGIPMEQHTLHNAQLIGIEAIATGAIAAQRQQAHRHRAPRENRYPEHAGPAIDRDLANCRRDQQRRQPDRGIDPQHGLVTRVERCEFGGVVHTVLTMQYSAAYQRLWSKRRPTIAAAILVFCTSVVPPAMPHAKPSRTRCSMP